MQVENVDEMLQTPPPTFPLTLRPVAHHCLWVGRQMGPPCNHDSSAVGTMAYSYTINVMT